LILLLLCLLLAGAGLLAMYSAGFDHGTRFVDHGRNMLIAAMLFVVAQVPPQRLMKVAVPLYTLGVALLVAVALFGITKKGPALGERGRGDPAQRAAEDRHAADAGLVVPAREGQLRAGLCVAFVLLLVPVGLIMKQPDLGTSLLVMAAGLSVIFLPACPGS
jgi:rod shape determining protein RodA